MSSENIDRLLSKLGDYEPVEEKPVEIGGLRLPLKDSSLVEKIDLEDTPGEETRESAEIGSMRTPDGFNQDGDSRKVLENPFLEDSDSPVVESPSDLPDLDYGNRTESLRDFKDNGLVEEPTQDAEKNDASGAKEDSSDESLEENDVVDATPPENLDDSEKNNEDSESQDVGGKELEENGDFNQEELKNDPTPVPSSEADKGEDNNSQGEDGNSPSKDLKNTAPKDDGGTGSESNQEKTGDSKGLQDRIRKGLTDKALSEANKIEALQKAKDLKQKAEKVRKIGLKIKGAFSSLANLLNPTNLIVLAVCIVLVLVAVTGTSIMSTLGQVERVVKCDIPGNTSLSKDAYGTSEAERAKSIGAWLMSTKFDFLGDKAMNNAQASGVLGNFVAESGLLTLVVENETPESYSKLESNASIKSYLAGKSRGIGLAQWTSKGRVDKLLALAESKGKNWSDLEIQLEHLKNELEGSYGKSLVREGFTKDSITPEESAKIFHKVYEASADDESRIKRRADKASEFSKIIGGSSMSTKGCRRTGTGGSSPDWGYPLEKEYGIVSPFGPRLGFNGDGTHYGLDFGVPCGENVLATNGGEVIISGYDIMAGNNIVVKHEVKGETVYTWYMHMLNGSLKFEKGDKVDKGMTVGLVGTTGNSTGCHLHYQVVPNETFTYNRNAVNPVPDYIGTPGK